MFRKLLWLMIPGFVVLLLVLTNQKDPAPSTECVEAVRLHSVEHKAELLDRSPAWVRGDVG